MPCLPVLIRRPSVPAAEGYFTSFGTFGRSGKEEFYREYIRRIWR
jgi:hypothetical protein